MCLQLQKFVSFCVNIVCLYVSEIQKLFIFISDFIGYWLGKHSTSYKTQFNKNLYEPRSLKTSLRGGMFTSAMWQFLCFLYIWSAISDHLLPLEVDIIGSEKQENNSYVLATFILLWQYQQHLENSTKQDN